MASKTKSQEKLFAFLSDRLATQAPFSLEELRTAAGFSRSAFRTYHPKHLKELLVPCGGGYRVHQGFRRFNSWKTFQRDVVSQTRKLIAKYQERTPSTVMVFEFFMPLRNEDLLRSGLDSLFYEDSIRQRLKSIDPSELATHFGNAKFHGSRVEFLNRAVKWISQVFVGYSISHVNGRYKVGDLQTRTAVATAECEGRNRYLVDETTAVVRFIFPIETIPGRPPGDAEVGRIAWCFDKLFVNSILEVVSGEDEVWLLESGLRSQLRRFESVS